MQAKDLYCFGIANATTKLRTKAITVTRARNTRRCQSNVVCATQLVESGRRD